MSLLRKLVLALALGVLVGGFCRPLAAEVPNIVWILGEDICPDLACYGTKGVKTPHLDRLAAEGILYTRAFTTSPVCSTSRSAMMTGMYQDAIGANQHRTANKKPLPSRSFPFPCCFRSPATIPDSWRAGSSPSTLRTNRRSSFPAETGRMPAVSPSWSR